MIVRSTTGRAVRRGVGMVCALTLAVGPAWLAAQGTTVVTVTPPPEDTLRSVTPTFVVSATGFGAGDLVPTRFQLDTSFRFTGPFVLDTTVLARGGAVTVSPTRALPENVRIFARAIVTDPTTGLNFASPITGPKLTPFWLTLITPPTVVGQPVRTRTPRFVWHSPQVNEPPGPWNYTITITNLGQISSFTNVGSDTSFVPKVDLELNAVYTWSVQATLARSGQSTIAAARTFFIEDPMQTVATTDMSPPFPSPFPGITRPGTCIWFDLKNASTVELDVFDLRGLHVRRLVPNADVNGTLPPGRYGRGRTETNEGCDPHFEWDGTDDRGVYAPEGVYLVRFRGDGVTRIRKVLFRGPP
ncbi:hypothetical protein J421_2944 [Gemmatirosa kalamazoonensis]|uniref:FlgD Ig-like domain-containing protein n=1 Tax=Gemmatirosa kalamazoonensis TaxID=861299 RepID=W0RI73_9BACT|nr:hypothetical protein J421_2944 [Gemmatirosa kalamazoonensis]